MKEQQKRVPIAGLSRALLESASDQQLADMLHSAEVEQAHAHQTWQNARNQVERCHGEIMRRFRDRAAKAAAEAARAAEEAARAAAAQEAPTP